MVGDWTFDLDSTVPIARGVGGTAPVTWTSFQFGNTGPCPGSDPPSEITYNGSAPKPGEMHLVSLKADPSILAVIDWEPAPSYYETSVGCVSSAERVDVNPLIRVFEYGHTNVTPAPTSNTAVEVTGWKRGTGDTWATDTLNPGEGTIELVIRSKP